jgi:hypothetical protein
MYLTNVDSESNGPIEFKEHGKMLGKAGTYFHYSANEVHRGCKSDIDRYALAMAFDASSKLISTVGTDSCNDVECPSGYKKKAVLPTEAPFDTTTCCEKSSDMTTYALIALLLVLAYFFFVRR